MGERDAGGGAPGDDRGAAWPPVLVTGMHRSGTSLVARLLNRCGLHLGEEEDMVPPAGDNPEGFWEHARLVGVDDDLLALFGAGWDHPRLPEGWSEDPRIGAALATLASETSALSEGRRSWGFKDPRLCLTLPAWTRRFPKAHVVAVVRNPLEVTVSLRERNGSSHAFGLQLWSIYYDALLAAAPPDRLTVTHFDAYFARPVEELHRVAARTGLAVDDGVLAAALESRHVQHRHSRFGWQDLAALGAAPTVRATYGRLCDAAQWLDDAPVPGTGRRTAPPAAAALAVVAGGDDPSAPGAGAVDGAALEARLLRYRYHRRGGHIALLERRVAELEAQVAGRPAASDAHLVAPGPGTEGLGALQRRLDTLEEELGAVRQAVAPGAGEPGYDLGRVARAVAGHGSLVVVAAPWTPPDQRFGRALRALPLPEWPPVDDSAAVWQLEALRAVGGSVLLRPHGVSGHERLVERAELLYPELEPVQGFRAFDLTRRTAAHRLLDAAHEVEAAVGTIPTFLDRTKRGVGDLLPLHPVIRAEAAPDHYVDGSVDVVIADDGADVDAARRIAAHAVVRVTPSDAVLEWVGEAPPVRTACVVVSFGAAPAGGRRIDALLGTLPHRVATSVLVSGPHPGWAPPSARVATATAGPDLCSLLGAGSRSTADVVVALESDAVALGHWLGPVLRLFEDDTVAAVCARWVAPDGTLLAAGGGDGGGGKERTHAGAGAPAESPEYRHVRRVPWAPGPVVAVRRDAIRGVAPAGGGPGVVIDRGEIAYQPEWVVTQRPRR